MLPIKKKRTRLELPYPTEDAHQQCIKEEVEWLMRLIEQRLEGNRDQDNVMQTLQNPPVLPSESHYNRFIKEWNISQAERVLLAMALAQTLDNRAFLAFSHYIKNTPMRYAFGGIFHAREARFVPNIQTFLFLITGQELALRGELMRHLQNRYALFTEGILEVYPKEEKVTLNSYFELSPPFSRYFLGGTPPRLVEEKDFPATLLTTEKNWDDLVLAEEVRQQLQPPMHYLRHFQTLKEGKDFNKKIKPGYLLLLYGPPGTGKTLTASLMGKELGRAVYYLNISRVVSKYIGETEKNLEKVFDRLDQQSCILVIDEADAILGKRTEVEDSNDRYANQEIAYLLQRVERFDGLLILTSNHDGNMDEAFNRRIMNKVYLGRPNALQRTEIWRRGIPEEFHYPDDSIPDTLGTMFALTGGQIHNVLKHACMMAINDKTSVLEFDTNLIAYINLEKDKEEAVKINSKNTSVKRNAGLENNPFADMKFDKKPPTFKQEMKERGVQIRSWNQYLPEDWSYEVKRLPAIFANFFRWSPQEIEALLKKILRKVQNKKEKVLYYTEMSPFLQEAYPATLQDHWNNVHNSIRKEIERIHTRNQPQPTEVDDTKIKEPVLLQRMSMPPIHPSSRQKTKGVSVQRKKQMQRHWKNSSRRGLSMTSKGCR